MSDVPEPTTRENVGNLSFANHRHVESSVVITLVWLGSGKHHVLALNTCFSHEKQGWTSMMSLKTPGDILTFLFLFPTNWNLSQGVFKITACCQDIKKAGPCPSGLLKVGSDFLITDIETQS